MIIEPFDTPFTVWKSEEGDVSLQSMPNGLVLRVGKNFYRIGNGNGEQMDGFLPVYRGTIDGRVFDRLGKAR